MDRVTRVGERCETCQFWKAKADQLPGDHVYGVCRIGPPAATTCGPLWPCTEPSDWCGKYEPKPVVVAPGLFDEVPS